MPENRVKMKYKARLENFLYHYKFHLIFGIIIAILVTVISYSTISNKIAEQKNSKLPPAAIEILLFGDYKVGVELPILEENLAKTFPQWKRVDLLIEYAPNTTESYEDIAAMQRSIAILHTEKPDIYIFDEHQFNKFIEDGTFVQLDEYFPSDNRIVTYQKSNDQQAFVYGIDITDSHLFHDIEIHERPKIAVINHKTEKLSEALEFIKGASADN